MFSFNCENALRHLGARLRRARLDRDEPQREFAARLGVSIPTLRKMENGEPSVSMGLWTEALELLGRLSELDGLLAPSPSLFAQYEAEKKKQRQRASRRDAT